MRPFLLPSFCVLFVLGCASPPKAGHADTASTSSVTLVKEGRIVDVRDIRIHDNKSAPLSSVIGGLLGGVAGSMIGSGSGQAIATAGGAIGGSIAAQQASKGHTQLTELTVRLDDGREATYDAAPEDAFRIGERVQIISHSGKPKITRIPFSPQ